MNSNAKMEELFYSSDSRSSVAEYVTSYIRNNILLLKYPAGMLLKEVPLAAAAGSSRSAVRSALQQLENEGLVEPLKNGRKKVCGFSTKHIRNLYEVRKMLELRSLTQILEEGNQCLHKHGREIISTALETCTFSVGTEQSTLERVRSDAVFHRSLIRATENYALLQCWNSIEPVIWSLLNINATMSDRDKHFEQYQTHDELIKMLLNGDSGVLERLEEHINISEGMVIETFKRLGLVDGENKEASPSC